MTDYNSILLALLPFLPVSCFVLQRSVGLSPLLNLFRRSPIKNGCLKECAQTPLIPGGVVSRNILGASLVAVSPAVDLKSKKATGCATSDHDTENPNTRSLPTIRPCPRTQKSEATSERREVNIFTQIKQACILYDTDESEFPGRHDEIRDDCPAIKKIKARNADFHVHCVGTPDLESTRSPISEELWCPCHGNELQIAIASRDIEIVERVLREKRVSIDEPSGPSGPPLNAAVERGLLDIVRLLISLKANVNNASPTTPSSFSLACTHDQYEIAEYLLRCPVWVHQNPGCLQEACYSGYAELVAVLLRWRSKPRGYYQESLPLTYCVQNAIRKWYGASHTNICAFLAGTSLPSRSIKTVNYMRACVIIEMLIQAGVKHDVECDCDREDWDGGHRILKWYQNHHRHLPHQEPKPVVDPTQPMPIAATAQLDTQATKQADSEAPKTLNRSLTADFSASMSLSCAGDDGGESEAD